MIKLDLNTEVFSWTEIIELADTGDLEAIRYCAASYASGDGCEEDIPKSRYYLEIGHGLQDNWCSYHLATRHVNWEDNEVGCKIIKAIAAMGYPPALYKLALCYYQGFGVERDLNKGFSYLQKAAKKGHVHAKYSMFSEIRKNSSGFKYVWLSFQMFWTELSVLFMDKRNDERVLN